VWPDYYRRMLLPRPDDIGTVRSIDGLESVWGALPSPYPRAKAGLAQPYLGLWSFVALAVRIASAIASRGICAS
jgi:hypothetical protein